MASALSSTRSCKASSSKRSEPPPPARSLMNPNPPAAPFIATRRPLSRRHFLQGAGIALALPFLDTMLPPFARAAPASSPLLPGAKPRRMLGICNNLGLRPDLFFPKDSGPDYTPSPYLQLLQEY